MRKQFDHGRRKNCCLGRGDILRKITCYKGNSERRLRYDLVRQLRVIIIQFAE